MYTSTELLDRLEQSMRRMTIDRQPASLYEPIEYVLSIGGKRVRPVLTLLAYNLYREDIERVMPQAIALETYHNYTLLHDDLMDNADVRRANPPCIASGMPTRPFFLVTLCWCWPISAWRSVTRLI